MGHKCFMPSSVALASASSASRQLATLQRVEGSTVPSLERAAMSALSLAHLGVLLLLTLLDKTLDACLCYQCGPNNFEGKSPK